MAASIAWYNGLLQGLHIHTPTSLAAPLPINIPHSSPPSIPWINHPPHLLPHFPSISESPIIRADTTAWGWGARARCCTYWAPAQRAATGWWAADACMHTRERTFVRGGEGSGEGCTSVHAHTSAYNCKRSGRKLEGGLHIHARVHFGLDVKAHAQGCVCSLKVRGLPNALVHQQSVKNAVPMRVACIQAQGAHGATITQIPTSAKLQYVHMNVKSDSAHTFNSPQLQHTCITSSSKSTATPCCE
eukprot:scaffold73926_cov20-Tisochrysis_lutea.AAC.2